MKKSFIIIFLFTLLVSSNLVFAQEVVEGIEATQKINQNNNFFNNPVNLVLIVLSALTVIFTILIIILALLAFFGWQSARDFKEKQKEFLIRQRKIIEEGEKEIKRNSEQAKKLIKELKEQKGKIKTPADFKRYKDKTEELISELEKSIKRAEDKMSDLKISGISSTSTIMGPTISDNQFLYTGVSSIEKRCGKCGQVYRDDPVARTSIYSQCPYCGHLNY